MFIQINNAITDPSLANKIATVFPIPLSPPVINAILSLIYCFRVIQDDHIPGENSFSFPTLTVADAEVFWSFF
jgi:hypothetical protein